MNKIINDIYDVLAKNEQHITQSQFVELLEDGTELDNATNTIRLVIHGGRVFELSIKEITV